MSYSDNLLLFFTLVFGIVIVPGMDMAFVMASGLAGGKKAGLAATGGIMAGGIFHNIWSALGVGLIINALPWLFNLLLLAGAVYIAWIGLSLVRSHITLGPVEAAPSRTTWATFRQGLVTSVLNPKAYLFMLAVYPQFIKPVYGSVAGQAVVMALIILVVQGSVYGALGMAAGHSRQWLSARPALITNISRCAGAVLIMIAVVTAWHGWKAL